MHVLNTHEYSRCRKRGYHSSKYRVNLRIACRSVLPPCTQKYYHLARGCARDIDLIRGSTGVPSRSPRVSFSFEGGIGSSFTEFENSREHHQLWYLSLNDFVVKIFKMLISIIIIIIIIKLINLIVYPLVHMIGSFVRTSFLYILVFG